MAKPLSARSSIATPGQRAQQPDQAAQHEHGEAAGVDGAGAQDRGDQLLGVAVEQQQRVVHMLAVVAVIGRPFLLTVGRVVGAVAVQQDTSGRSIGLPLAHVQRRQRVGEPLARPPVDAVLQPRQRRLTGQRVAGGGQLPTG